MSDGPTFPTGAHARAAEAITSFFSGRPETDAVLVTNSCARGRATPDSCLDLQVVVPPAAVAAVGEAWCAFHEASSEIAELRRAGRWSVVHLDVGDGTFEPGPIDEEGIDFLEVGVGNLFVYSVPLFVRGDRLEQLGAPWLPFYGDELRRERLDAARRFIRGDLDRIPWFVGRGLHFQAFDRLYRAFQAFLLGLHVSRRVYPIAYDKWIEEQVAGNLGLPELYERLPRLFELGRFESRELETKADELRALAEEYVVG